MAYKEKSPIPVTEGGSGAQTLTGVLTGNGTSAFTASAITQHDVLVGGATNAITSVAPSATSGIPLVSQGASSDPHFGTAVVAGGGTGDTSFTAFAPICGGTTTTGVLQSASTGIGTSGFVLTSTGGSSLPTFQAVAAGITTINGNSGSVTGSTITITGTDGSGVFTGSGTTLTLSFNKGTQNTFVGLSSGAAIGAGGYNSGFGAHTLETISTANYNTAVGRFALNASNGDGNTACGYFSGQAITSGTFNSSFGYATLDNATITGSYNLALGANSASNYTSSEASNIMINNNGTLGESHVLRIGAGTGTGTQQLSTAYISGINGNTVSNQVFVTINSSTDQLGTTTTVPVGNGGTGATSFATTNGIVKYDGTKLVTSSTATIDGSNIMTNTSQPAFCAFLSTTQTNTTGNGTLYKVICDTALSNQGTHYNTSTGVFTAPVAGLYRFECSVTYSNLAAGHTEQSIRFTNSVSTASRFLTGYANPNGGKAASSGFFSSTNAVLMHLGVNDTVELDAFVDGSTQTVSIVGADSTQNYFTYFSGSLVC